MIRNSTAAPEKPTGIEELTKLTIKTKNEWHHKEINYLTDSIWKHFITNITNNSHLTLYQLVVDKSPDANACGMKSGKNNIRY